VNNRETMTGTKHDGRDKIPNVTLATSQCIDLIYFKETARVGMDIDIAYEQGFTISTKKAFRKDRDSNGEVD
jgi:hypothetical protein